MDDQQDRRDVERAIERLVERYVDELIAGHEPDLEAMARELPDAESRAKFRAQALAQAYVLRSAEGAEVELEAYLRQLRSEAERELFHEVLRDEERARAHLPGDLVPGMKLDGRYEIRRELGRGGMGIVYAALDHVLQREVAVKVLRSTAGGVPPGWDELFLGESRTLARLRSRNIVTIHDAHRGVRSYIVMDLVPGKDLLRVLEELLAGNARLQPGSSPPLSSSSSSSSSPEPLRRAIGRAVVGERDDLLGERSHARCVARIVRLIALTLEHAHGAGVIHRDIKPQNVMLVPGGEPVLLDFGLASWGQEGTEEGFRGTPEYMAPEQIERLRAGNDPRTDVYQLGLVLYEMLALRRAFPRRSQNEEVWLLFQRIQAGETQALSEVAPRGPRALAAIAEKALARDPERRYPDMRALRADLDRFLARLPPEGVALSPSLRLGMHVDHALHQPFTAVVCALGLAALLWVRTPPWVPPVLALVKAESSQVAKLEDGQRIELADDGVLGLDVEADDATWLYVFQLFGTSEDDKRAQFLRPVYPSTFLEYTSNEAVPAARGVRFEPGSYRLACAVLDDPQDYEGLLVFASPGQDEILDEWQRTLLELEVANGIEVTFEEAGRHLDNLKESLRGGPPGKLSLEARRRAVGSVQAAEKEGTIPRKYHFLHRVRRAAGGDSR